MVEAAELKKLAEGYMYPEAEVINVDGAAFGCNYFMHDYMIVEVR